MSSSSNPPFIQVSLSRALAYPQAGVCESQLEFTCLSGSSVSSILSRDQKSIPLAVGSPSTFTSLVKLMADCDFELFSSSSCSVQQKETGNDFLIHTYVFKAKTH